MPWTVVADDPGCPMSEPFGVRKDADNKLAGCHATRADANDQLAALHAAEADRAADDTFTPPQGVQDAAQRALGWIADGLAGDGFTAVGRRRASQLANGEPVSRETVGRMANYFGRHALDRDAEGFERGEDGYPTPGRVAWDAWGGDAGRDWSASIVESERSEVMDVREMDESAHPVTSRQRAQYESTESIVELFGQFDQGIGPDGAHYVAESPFAGEGLACSSCVFYEGPRACEVVSGDIDPAGICKLWVIPADLVADPAPVEGEPVVEDQPMDAPMEANSGDGGDYHRTSGGVTVPDREVRHISRLELRTDDATGLPVLEGYATVYDYAYDIGGGPDNGGFTEVIARGATAKSAQEADVRLLANHSGLPLARTRSGSMTLESDDIGLRVRALLDPTNPAAAEVISGMTRGDIDQMSFAFKVVRDSWSADYNKRTISEVRLFDVSVVTYPANNATVVKLRADNDGETETVAAKSGGGRSIELARRQLVAEVSRKR